MPPDPDDARALLDRLEKYLRRKRDEALHDARGQPPLVEGVFRHVAVVYADILDQIEKGVPDE